MVTKYELFRFSPSSHSVYYPYQIREAFHYVTEAKKRLQLNRAFLDRFDNYYSVEFRHEYDLLEPMLNDCVWKLHEIKCSHHVQKAFDAAVRGQFAYLSHTSKQAHNDMVETAVNVLIVLGRMNRMK